MAKFIGLTGRDDRRVMVNMDLVTMLDADEDTDLTRVFFADGDPLRVKEDIYTIVEMTEPYVDYEVTPVTTYRRGECRYCSRYGTACGRPHSEDTRRDWGRTWDGWQPGEGRRQQ